MTRRHNRRSQEWGPPVNLGCVINTTMTEIAPAFFENPETGQVTLFYGAIALARRASTCMQALWARTAFGPGALVPEFSSPGRDTRIFIRRDGLEVFITSDRTGGQGYRHLDVNAGTLSDMWPTPIDVPVP